MITASPRLGALLAGGTALVAFGLTAPALADAGGANSGCGNYCSTSDGSPSENGNGNGNAYGRPAAGSVGKADDKNPPGQAPDWADANNGYECDGNNGIGKTNPAHSGCGDGGYPDLGT